MPKSYKQSSGSGMPSYFDNLGAASASASTYSTPSEPSFSTNNAPTTSGAGLPSYTNSLSGGNTGKMKESSFMPKSFKKTTGSGMPSYFDSMGSASSDSYSSQSTPPPVSQSSTSGAGMPSYTASLSGDSGSAKMKESSFMPKSYKQSSGSGMPSYFDSMAGGTSGDNTASSGTGLPSYTASLSGNSGNTMKEPSYMPKSYKQPSGAGMPSYLDNMGSAWSAPPKVETKAPPPNIRPNIALPPKGIKSDQAAELARIASPARGPSFSPRLANQKNRVATLPCDQTTIMRDGEAFLPHSQDPVIKRGNLEPDQSSAMRYFFTGRLCATEPFRPIPMKGRFPSDQERADNQTRRSLMYFQKATKNIRRNPPEN